MMGSDADKGNQMLAGIRVCGGGCGVNGALLKCLGLAQIAEESV